jgi:prolyl 4-hydroxylase
LIYLNAVELGSETFFRDLGIELTPVIVSAVVWNCILPNGDVNPVTAHCVRPMIKGEKFVTTKWFRAYGNLREIYKTSIK